MRLAEKLASCRQLADKFTRCGAAGCSDFPTRRPACHPLFLRLHQHQHKKKVQIDVLAVPEILGIASKLPNSAANLANPDKSWPPRFALICQVLADLRQIFALNPTNIWLGICFVGSIALLCSWLAGRFQTFRRTMGKCKAQATQ